MSTIERTLAELNDNLIEVKDRARRTETALHRLRDFLGANETLPDTVRARDSGHVEIQGYDVTMAQIKKALLQKEWFNPTDRVSLCMDGDIVATVTFHKA